jgi:hypothetical protein
MPAATPVRSINNKPGTPYFYPMIALGANEFLLPAPEQQPLDGRPGRACDDEGPDHPANARADQQLDCRHGLS